MNKSDPDCDYAAPQISIITLASLDSNEPDLSYLEAHNYYYGNDGPYGDNYYHDDGTPIWPDDDGFESGTKTTVNLSIGTRIDRYGGPSGKFASPYGTPFGERSLSAYTSASDYHVYELNASITVTQGRVAPWFGWPGGGVQYKFDNSISTYLANGEMSEVDP